MVFFGDIHHPAVEDEITADEREAHEDERPTGDVRIQQPLYRFYAEHTQDLVEHTVRTVDTFAPNKHGCDTRDNPRYEHERTHPVRHLFVTDMRKQECEDEWRYDTEEQVGNQEEQHVPYLG